MENYRKIDTGVTGADEDDIILISEKALQRLKELKNANCFESSYIRISVVGNSCQGMKFVLGFDDKYTKHDKVYSLDNEIIVIDFKSVFYLMGVRLEYNKNKNPEFQFVFPFNMRALECQI